MAVTLSLKKRLENQEGQFLYLIEKHQGTLKRICKAYTPDAEEARDLFQDVLVELWRSFPQFRGESSRYTWMYRVALYTAMNYYRRAKMKMIDRWEDQARYEESPVENHEALYQAIKQLDEKDRGLVVLYLEEHSYEEMAEIIGITPNHIGVRINRIKKKLRQLINQQRDYGRTS